MIRIFMDMEFTGLHQKTSLLSIALLTEDGKAFYREMSDYVHDEHITDWMKDNVMPNLGWASSDPDEADRAARSTITMFQLRNQLEEWFGQLPLSSGEQIEIWTDVGSYDWVLFNSIWDNALNKPDYIHYIPRDIATFFHVMGLDPDTDRWQFAEMDPSKPKHNALWDAVAISRCYVILDKIREAQFIQPQLTDLPSEALMADDIPTESASDTPQETTKGEGEGLDTGETQEEAPKAKPKPKTTRKRTTTKKTTKKTEGS